MVRICLYRFCRSINAVQHVVLYELYLRCAVHAGRRPKKINLEFGSGAAILVGCINRVTCMRSDFFRLVRSAGEWDDKSDACHESRDRTALEDTDGAVHDHSEENDDSEHKVDSSLLT